MSAAGVWYYLEVEAFVHDTTGFVRVYRDGVLLVAAENQDTRGQAGSHLVEMIRFIGNNGGGTSDGPNIWSIDDICVLDDSTRLGQCRVSTLLPHADTAAAGQPEQPAREGGGDDRSGPGRRHSGSPALRRPSA